MRLANQGCVLFTTANDVAGNDTLGDVNHCLVIMRYAGGAMVYNSAQGGASTKLKLRDWVFSDYEINEDAMLKNDVKEIGQSEKSIAGLGGSSAGLPVVGNFVKKPLNRETYTKLELYKSYFNFFNLPPQIDLTAVEKPKVYNVNPIDEDTFFFYDLVNRYKNFLRPKYLLDVGVFKNPNMDFFYGKPMFCHNFVVQIMGLTVGNVLTSLHLKQRLIEWSGKTNFFTQELFVGPWF